jgi:uncharacterized protein (TIRG00374 family)
MDRKKIIQSIFFLTIGVGLFWFVYKDTDLNNLKNQLERFNLLWIGVSVALNMLSQLVRAHRWKLLFKPLQYKPKTYNLFLAVLILAFTNQIIPRGGEIARLGVINRVEKVPFSKLVGMALAERLTDFIILMLIFTALLIWQFARIKELLSLPQINMQQLKFADTLLVVAIIIIAIVVLVTIAIKKFDWFKKARKGITKIKDDMGEGFSSLRRIKHKGLYFFESFLIYTLWLFMLYVLFFAYPPTNGLSFEAAIFTFGLATMAFLIPIQAGMGAWHFVVIQCLLLFGIDTESGKAFSLVAHAATNIIYLIPGAIAFALLPIVNKNYRK